MNAYVALVKADLDLALLGIHEVAARLPVVAYRQASSDEISAMLAVTSRVQGAALYYRPGARCLPQAVAITRLLRRHRYPVTFVVAVRRFPFAAHSWVECHEQVLTDRQDVRLEFAPILVNTPATSQHPTTP
jgi:hypothetical protein